MNLAFSIFTVCGACEFSVTILMFFSRVCGECYRMLILFLGDCLFDWSRLCSDYITLLLILWAKEVLSVLFDSFAALKNSYLSWSLSLNYSTLTICGRDSFSMVLSLAWATSYGCDDFLIISILPSCFWTSSLATSSLIYGSLRSRTSSWILNWPITPTSYPISSSFPGVYRKPLILSTCPSKSLGVFKSSHWWWSCLSELSRSSFCIERCKHLNGVSV